MSERNEKTWTSLENQNKNSFLDRRRLSWYQACLESVRTRIQYSEVVEIVGVVSFIRLIPEKETGG